MTHKKVGAGRAAQVSVSRLSAEPRPAEWTAALDRPVAAQVQAVGEPIEFSGWVLNRRKPVVGVRLIRERDEQPAGELETGLARDGVAQLHARIRHAATCGFGGQLTLAEAGSYRIECAAADGHWLPLFTFSLRDPALKPTRLMFMHIAKTAGTSVNRFLADNAGAANCAFHLEIDPRWRSAEGRARLANVAVISGHITYPALKRRLDCADYLKATVLRDPTEQLFSHLSFIRQLAEPSERQRLAGHTPSIQAFAAKLAATDFGSAEALAALVDGLLPEELMLVDNLQVRYLSAVAPGERVQQAHLEDARHALSEFEIVGFTDELGEFLGRIAGARGWPQPLAVPQENRQPARYGLETATAEIVAVLKPLLRYDEKLYRYARKVYVEGKTGPVRRLKKKKAGGDRKRVQGSAPATT